MSILTAGLADYASGCTRSSCSGFKVDDLTRLSQNDDDDIDLSVRNVGFAFCRAHG